MSYYKVTYEISSPFVCHYQQGYADKIKTFINNRMKVNVISDDFNWRVYLYLNPEVTKQQCSEEFAVNHWIWL